jgi:DNA modification methylase
MLLLHGDCNELMKELPDKSVDLIFTDLPYGQVSCDWDKKIDLEKMWEQFMRVKKVKTPLFFCCSTKFGVELINSAPKKCPFRYDIVWVKSAPCGFLCARKMPMKKHEMLYVFYEKLPFYDLSSHKHKFSKKATASQNGATYGGGGDNPDAEVIKHTYDPPLPTSVQKETINGTANQREGGAYGKDWKAGHQGKDNKKTPAYDPPLPTSVQKEGGTDHDTLYGQITIENPKARKKGESRWEPALPTSVQKEMDAVKLANDFWEDSDIPDEHNGVIHSSGVNGVTGQERKTPLRRAKKGEEKYYDPPLPNTILEIKSQRGKHSTQKPLDLMKWVLKYYSKEGDVVLDPTMGSGSTGVACKEMNREFVGIEMNPEIYETAVNRIED